MMTKRYNISIAFLILFLLGLTPMEAQLLNTPFELSDQIILSPIDRQYREITMPINERQTDHLFAGQYSSKDDVLRDSAFIRFGSAYADITGDYLPYNGNNYSSLSLESGGRISIQNYGTLRGTASYSRGMHKRVGWNSIRNLEACYPYIVADSTGGDYHFEDYRLAGNYSFMAGRLPLNIGFAYRGEVAYRLTDPRSTNTTGALELSLATSLSLPKENRLHISAAYLYHRQHITQYNWRPGQQDKFFVSYGFGQVDVSNSHIWFGYSRMNFINGWKLGSYLSTPKGSSIRLDYMGYYLNTEEASSMNLFALLYNRLSLHGKWRLSDFSVDLSADYALRNGIERIYEEYQPDDNYDIYDYRILAIRHWYHLNEFSAKAQASYRFRLGQGHSLNISAGSDFYGYDERYRQKEHHIMNGVLRPFAGIAYDHPGDRSDFGLSLLAAYRLVLTNSYKVRIMQKEQLDYQLAFLPYAYRNREGVEVRGAVYVSVPMWGANRLLAELQLYGDVMNRKAGILYNKDPGVVSHLLSDPQAEQTSGHTISALCRISYLF